MSKELFKKKSQLRDSLRNYAQLNRQLLSQVGDEIWDLVSDQVEDKIWRQADCQVLVGSWDQIEDYINYS